MTALDVLRWTEIYAAGAAQLLVILTGWRCARMALRRWPEPSLLRLPETRRRAFGLFVMGMAALVLFEKLGPSDLTAQWWQQTLHGPFEVAGVVSIIVIELLQPVVALIAALAFLVLLFSLLEVWHRSDARTRFRSRISARKSELVPAAADLH